MAKSFFLTCEHGGNTIPEEYIHLFAGNEEILYSHKAIDHGALRLAKHCATDLGLPLLYTTISRILVEANRSPDEEELFSEFTKEQPKEIKQDILEKYYYPHRNRVEDTFRDLISNGEQVIHIAFHTFAPAFEGDVRETEVGILFDPTRGQEQGFAEAYEAELMKVNPERKIHFNSPYPGTLDCLPSFLRKRFNQDQYLGFELEINQKFFLCGEPRIWENLVQELSRALIAVKGKF